MASRRTRRIFYGVRVFFAWLCVAICLVLWRLNQSLPNFALRWVEKAISSDNICFRCEKASFNILHGLTLRDVDVYARGVIGPPVGHLGELRIVWDIELDAPIHTWAKYVHARDLVIESFPDLPESESDPIDLEETFKHLSIDHDWATTPRHVVIDGAKIFGVDCKFIEFDISIQEAILRLDAVRIVPRSLVFLESLEGAVQYSPSIEMVHAALSGTITPDVIRNLTLSLDGESAVEYYDAITHLSEPLQVQGEVTWISSKDDKPSYQDMRVTIKGNNFKFRGRPVRRMGLSLQWFVDPEDASEMGKRLLVSPIDAFFPDGTLHGAVAWYPRTRATDLTASAVLPPRTLFPVLDITTPNVMTNIAFAHAPRSNVRGRIYGRASTNRVDSLLGGTITASEMALRGVVFQNVSTDWSYSSMNRFTFSKLNAECHGGTVNGDIAVTVGPDDTPTNSNTSSITDDLKLHFNFDNIKSDYFRDLINPSEPSSKGMLSGEILLSSSLNRNDSASLNGFANLKVRDAELMRVPLFAGLTDFLGRNVAGVDTLLMQSDSDFEVSITNGLATIDRLTLDGNLLSVVVNGKCRLSTPTRPLDGVAQVRFFHSRSLIGKLARIATLPLSKFMEFRITGPLSEPSWEYIGLVDRIAEATFWPRKDATEVDQEEDKSSQGEGD